MSGSAKENTRGHWRETVCRSFGAGWAGGCPAFLMQLPSLGRLALLLKAGGFSLGFLGWEGTGKGQ